jgi:hypothetical protein
MGVGLENKPFLFPKGCPEHRLPPEVLLELLGITDADCKLVTLKAFLNTNRLKLMNYQYWLSLVNHLITQRGGSTPHQLLPPPTNATMKALYTQQWGVPSKGDTKKLYKQVVKDFYSSKEAEEEAILIAHESLAIHTKRKKSVILELKGKLSHVDKITQKQVIHQGDIHAKQVPGEGRVQGYILKKFEALAGLNGTITRSGDTDIKGVNNSKQLLYVSTHNAVDGPWDLAHGPLVGKQQYRSEHPGPAATTNNIRERKL